jgi:hypothetical protein
MLKTIAIVTILVSQLGPVETAWQDHLGYETRRQGEISPELATAWDAPRMAGSRFILMEPASGEPVQVRFVERPRGVQAVEPFMTHGWNAAELLVQDPDGLARRLEGSPFRIIGPPADLTPQPDAPRAMQVVGPGNEVLYLTRIIPGGTGFDLGQAGTPVDRVFITVVAGPSLPALKDWYRSALGMPVAGEDFLWPVEVLARAHGLPLETRYPLNVAILPRLFLVELDEYPAVTRPRPRREGYLPGGMAMVSFTVESLAPRAEGGGPTWRHPPKAIADYPYRGRRVAVTVGPAGEWIEAIETPTTP